MKKTKYLWPITVIGILVAVLVLLFLAYTKSLSPSNSKFVVNGRTEIVEFTCLDNNVGNYVFYDAEISHYDNSNPIEKHFNGTARLRPGTKVRFERTSNTPNLLITFQSKDTLPPILLYKENSEGRKAIKFHKDSANYVEILVPIQDTTLAIVGSFYFPLDGQATIGNNIDRPNWGEAVSLILDAELSVVGRSLVINKFIEYENISLYPGDQVKFSHNFVEERKDKNTEYSEDEKLSLKGQGFVIIDDGPGMKINYRTKADKALIFKTGIKTTDSSYDVHISFLDKLLLDKTFHTLSIFIAFISIMAGGASLYFDYKGYQGDLRHTGKKKKKKKK